MVFWGGNNAAAKHLIASGWGPFWTSSSRMGLCALLLMLLMRWTPWFGVRREPDPALRRELWWRGGLSLAVYAAVFTYSLQHTSVARVAVFLGASPLWMLLMEGRGHHGWQGVRRFAAAFIALSGVILLFWPQLRGGGNWLGDGLGLLAGVLWAGYCRLCGAFQGRLNGSEITAHTMGRAAILLAPLAAWEIASKPPLLAPQLVGLQVYCAVFGGVIAFGVWHGALLRWPPGRVFLFNNLIPLTTMLFAWQFLGEKVSGTFLLAMALVVAGVILGQTGPPPAAVPPARE